MGPRLGIHKYKILHYQSIAPWLVSKIPAMTQEEWEMLVEYFYYTSPDTLPIQELPIEPFIDPGLFNVKPFTDQISPEAIITMLKIDTLDRTVYACDVYTNLLHKFDQEGVLIDTMRLSSPPTAMRIGDGYYDFTLAGILHPNNEQQGEIIRYQNMDRFPAGDKETLINKLYRPVTSIPYDLNYDGQEDFVVCEYGNDFGRLSVYFGSDSGFSSPYIIENIPGSIMIKLHDMNADGLMDIVALFAQGDEKIMIYYNDGDGNFRGHFTQAARFPAVYGSMYFELCDMNNDGMMDIIYVNGDNFDYSQILKPYHGIRILENDGTNSFNEKYFYPVYGAANVLVHDFDIDGDQDLLITSNFADMENSPERGVIYLQNQGNYNFIAHSFTTVASNQWNVMDMADLDKDGDMDVIIGAMNLQNVFDMASGPSAKTSKPEYTSLLFFENTTR